MVFQDPMTSLNPYLDIGTQMMEALRTHDRSLNRAEARRRCVEMLDRVAIPDADRRMRSTRTSLGHAPAGDDRHRPAQ